jgi:hypothetical protein
MKETLINYVREEDFFIVIYFLGKKGVETVRFEAFIHKWMDARTQKIDNGAQLNSEQLDILNCEKHQFCADLIHQINLL